MSQENSPVEHQPFLIKKIWAAVQQNKRRSVHDLQAVNVTKCAQQTFQVFNYFWLEFKFEM